ncbi:hypothetical protein VTI74DRAFT_1346 [Chaetomium olivicolor]
MQENACHAKFSVSQFKTITRAKLVAVSWDHPGVRSHNQPVQVSCSKARLSATRGSSKSRQARLKGLEECFHVVSRCLVRIASASD